MERFLFSLFSRVFSLGAWEALSAGGEDEVEGGGEVVDGIRSHHHLPGILSL